MASDTPPQLLQIYRDPVARGREAAYKVLEEDAARVCARLRFPNPHLAIESLSGPREVWWLNAFASEVERQRVVRDYLANPTLVAALEDIARRKQGLTGTALDLVTRYQADLSARTWSPAGARFFVVTVGRPRGRTASSVFEAPGGTLYSLTPARTRREAGRVAATSGEGARVFAVRPYWGMPAREWIAADPEFWKPSPMARQP